MKKVLAFVLTTAVIFTCLCGFSKTEATGGVSDIYTIQSEQGSEYGYSDYKIVDEWGNEVEFGTDPEYYVPNSSGAMFFSVTPEEYDARDYGYVTDVKDQGRSGNCWVFSTTSALENDSIVNGIETAETADFSEAHFSWFASRTLTDDTSDLTYGDGYNVESPYLKGGNWQTATAALSRWSGLANESDYPFNPANLSAMGNYSESSRYDTGSGTVINSAEILLDANDIKQWITEHGSSVVSFYYGDGYFNGNTDSYYYNGTPQVNHQVTVIGWDDNYSADNFGSVKPEADGAWLCKNSWGGYWGNGGYFWLSYYDTSLKNFTGFSSKSIDENDKNYTYNGAGYECFFYGSSSIMTANVFTAESCEKLTAVSIYTVTPASDVTVKIYTNLKSNYTKPIDGTLVSTFETFIARKGYHTIELPEAIQLAPGTIFSVVIECEDAEGVRYIPIEIDGRTETSYSSNKGESFMNMSGRDSAWKDTYSQGYGNLLIQAFTETGHSIVTETEESTCTSGGYEKTYCTGCGTVANERKWANASHTFGEWSEYEEAADGKMVSIRACSECGITEQKHYTQGNVVSLQDFIEMIFSRIFEMFKFSF